MIKVQQNLKILFIEDSENDAILMKHCLNGICADFQYHRVDSKEELLSVLEDDKWDIIITDNSLPQLSGVEVIKLIRKKGIKTPIICVSGTDIVTNTAEACINTGAHAFILKNNLEELKEIVENLIEVL